MQITGNSSEVILKITKVTKVDINCGTIIEFQTRMLFWSEKQQKPNCNAYNSILALSSIVNHRSVSEVYKNCPKFVHYCYRNLIYIIYTKMQKRTYSLRLHILL